MDRPHGAVPESRRPRRKRLARWIAVPILAAVAGVLVFANPLVTETTSSDGTGMTDCADCSNALASRSSAATSSTTGPLSAIRERVTLSLTQFISSLTGTTQDSADDEASSIAMTREGDCAAPFIGIEGRCDARRASNPASVVSHIGSSSGPGLSLAGRVMDKDGLGIPDIAVVLTVVRAYGEPSRLNTTGEAAFRSAKTDASGLYEFTGLPQGDYEVRTAAYGAYRPARIAARSGVRNADVVLLAQDTISIGGQVLSTAGEPLEAVTVLPMLVAVPSVQTDASGRYSLPLPLEPGTRSVQLRFQLPGFLDQRATVTIDGRDGVLALDARMQSVEHWTSVSGTVKTPSGSPLAGSTVELRQAGGQRAYRTITDQKGHYSFEAVEAPVSYQLSVQGGPAHKDHRQRVDVSRQAARLDIIVEPYEFGKIRGRLVNAEGAPVSHFDLVLKNAASSTPNAVVSSDPEGNFEVPLAPAGELTLASQSSPSILVRGLRLEAGKELDLPLVLDWGQHELTGVILDQNDQPVPTARVLLTWSHDENGITTITTRRARSDAQGAFRFTDLGPGPHVLQVDVQGRRPLRLAHDVTRQGYFVRVGL